MSLTPEQFRQVMGTWATGVTVVTYIRQDGLPGGLTANSFTSVSLDPTLVLVCVAKPAESHQELQAANSFAVNVLAADQEGVSGRFATSKLRANERYDGVAWSPAPSGAPFLDGCLSHMDCDIVERYEGGDHTIFLARVTSADVQEGQPLLFFGGKYAQVG